MNPDNERANRGNILVVDDTPVNLRLLQNILSRQGYQVRPVPNGPLALDAVESSPPDIILLDIKMPDMDGYEVCERLKANAKTAEIPVIFISAMDDVQDKLRAFSVGGVDYITKPFQADEVLARVKTHLTLRITQRELQERIQELDAFSHTVAHDLKNPVNVITGYVELLKGVDDNETRIEFTNSIGRTALKINKIIDELLLLAGLRKTKATPAPLDMAEVVDEVRDRLVGMIENYKATLIVPDQWPVAMGYGPWVEEIWVNYVSNAIKYGGAPPLVELGATDTRNGAVVFWVRDNGAGLTDEQQARLFAKFERLDQVRTEGHGLGLSIVERIVRKLGGEVSVESKPGQGSVFKFSLPAVD
jgi:two-component system sensor histidine kinase/response regulator